MVLGMHRSGTSALTRVFGLLGADLPKNLMVDYASNPTGHWESNDLFVIHDRLLASAGSSWHDWRAFNPDWFASPAARPFVDEILAVLRKDFAGSRLFAIKDPRICRFWPLWRDVLAEFGAKPLIVMPVRNPLEVAASLKQRDGFVLAKSHLLWLRHVLDAEHATRGLPRAVTMYQSLVEDWQQAIAAMTPQLRLSWPRRGATVDLEIEQFLSAELKSHTATPERLAAKPEVTDWVREAYAALTHMTQDAENRADMARLDRVCAAFDKASAAFGVALAMNEMEVAKRDADVQRLSTDLSTLREADAQREREQQAISAGLSSELEVLRATVSDRELKLVEHERRIAEFGEQLSAIKQKSDDLIREREALAVALEAVQVVADERGRERDQFVAALEQEKGAAARSNEQITALSREAEGLRGAIQEYDATATDLLADLEKMQAAAQERARERDELGAALESEKAAAARVVEELAVTQTELRERDGKVGRLARELEAARLYLRDSQAEVQRLAGELDGAAAEVARAAAERQGLSEALAAACGERDRLAAALERARQDVEWRGERLTDLSRELRAADAEAAHARRLEAESNEKAYLAAELARAGEEARRMEQSAAKRAAALERAQAAALAQSEKEAQARVAALRSELVDAEAALAKLRGERGAPAWKRLLSPSQKRRLGRQLVRSGLFDAKWYVREYPEAAKNGQVPVEHYLEEGYLRGFRPNPLFDSRWYLERYEDVRRAGVNPLVHYLQNGYREGRNPGPGFQTAYYLEANPDVRGNGMNPLAHYLRYGRHEGRLPRPSE